MYCHNEVSEYDCGGANPATCKQECTNILLLIQLNYLGFVMILLGENERDCMVFCSSLQNGHDQTISINWHTLYANIFRGVKSFVHQHVTSLSLCLILPILGMALLLFFCKVDDKWIGMLFNGSLAVSALLLWIVDVGQC